MALDDALQELDTFLAGYQQSRMKDPPAPIELLIICPDCGKNPPFRNRCPKCGGDSWIPAGPVSGIFEWVKARQWRRIVGAPPSPGERIVPTPGEAPDPGDRRKARRQRRRRKRPS